jgi:hypothetical protein
VNLESTRNRVRFNSAPEIIAAIEEYLDARNEAPKPFELGQ